MKRTLLTTLLLLAATTATAPAEEANHAGISFTGAAGFLRQNVGSFVFFYERGLTSHHAVRVAGDFLHVHHNADHVQSHQWTYGGSLGYRYHFQPAGFFVGAEVGVRRGKGHFGHADSPEHTMLANRQLRFLPELGYRHLHPRLPLSFVTRVGVGYGPYTVTTDRDDAMAHDVVHLSQDNLATTPLIVDIELSAAYRF